MVKNDKNTFFLTFVGFCRGVEYSTDPEKLFLMCYYVYLKLFFGSMSISSKLVKISQNPQTPVKNAVLTGVCGLMGKVGKPLLQNHEKHVKNQDGKTCS